jgi:glutaredoxin
MKVILYSKPGCHLCEEMKAELAKAAASIPFSLTEINIEEDEILLARYGPDIPVLTIDGVEAFKHRVSVAEFENYLAQRPLRPGGPSR